MRFYLIFLVLIVVQTLNGQSRLSTPMEIMSFMEASPTTYKIDQLLGELYKKKRKVMANGTFIEVVDNIEYAVEYEQLESCKEMQWREKALDLLAREKANYKKARKLYQKILKTSPDNAQIMTYLGQSYYETGDLDLAMDWLNKAIATNPVDYSAHQLKAEIFVLQDQLDDALLSISKAHLFNRNNKFVLGKLKEIYKAKQQDYYEQWAFEPKYQLELEQDTVIILADGIWLTYGMYQAVWTYEPDYTFIKENQQVSDFLFHAEMEAALGTFLTYSALKKEDQRNYPAMRAIEIALDHEMLEAFVMYEILLVDHPTLAAHLTESFLLDLIKYMATVRSKDLMN